MCLWHAYILSRMQNLSWSLFVFFPAIWSLVLIGSSSECGFQAAQLDDVFVKAHNWTLHNTLTISDGNANKKNRNNSQTNNKHKCISAIDVVTVVVVVVNCHCVWLVRSHYYLEWRWDVFFCIITCSTLLHSFQVFLYVSLSIAKLSNVHSVQPFNRQETVVSLRPGTGRLKYLYWLLMILDDALEMCARASYTLYATPATDKQIK